MKAFATPFDNAVATARTCASPRVVTDEDVARSPEQRDRIARSVYEAGHHTTLGHAHLQFALVGVSPEDRKFSLRARGVLSEGRLELRWGAAERQRGPARRT